MDTFNIVVGLATIGSLLLGLVNLSQIQKIKNASKTDVKRLKVDGDGNKTATGTGNTKSHQHAT